MLWNIDLTLVDVVRVSREAYADAFQQVTGKRLIQLPQFAGQSESEIFFDALARNAFPDTTDDNGSDGGDALLAAFYDALARAFAAHRDELTGQGRLLPGAAQAVETLASRHRRSTPCPGRIPGWSRRRSPARSSAGCRSSG